ncbi:MAG: ABC transporter permease [Anaerolineaceae bacterium]|nr:ABC transporter permease [Anaerolineaceae bacterium]
MILEANAKQNDRFFTTLKNTVQRNPAILTWLFVMTIAFIASFIVPGFLSSRNLLNILRQSSLLGIIAIGQTYALLSRGADLSQSATMTLCAVVAFKVLDGTNENILPVIALALALGAGIGVFNGVIISNIKVPPFLMTLGTRQIIFGLALVYTGGTPSGNVTKLFRSVLGQFTFLGIPGQVFIWAGLILIFLIILKKTTYGPKLYATGGNPSTARQSGIKVKKVVIIAYVISGVLAAVGGLVLAARAGYADNVLGQGYELNAVAASVIGGTAFTGGRGGLIGTVGGVILMTVLQNILNIVGLNPSYFLVVSGLVIVIAVTMLKTSD